MAKPQRLDFTSAQHSPFPEDIRSTSGVPWRYMLHQWGPLKICTPPVGSPKICAPSMGSLKIWAPPVGSLEDICSIHGVTLPLWNSYSQPSLPRYETESLPIFVASKHLRETRQSFSPWTFTSTSTKTETWWKEAPPHDGKTASASEKSKTETGKAATVKFKGKRKLNGNYERHIVQDAQSTAETAEGNFLCLEVRVVQGNKGCLRGFR